MKHIKTIAKAPLVREGKSGCGECQTSCQSACKTSCTVANQPCGQKRIRNGAHISRAE
ncbi:MAG: six-cysteine ranthipeptide SCIFF [Clostridiales bacterium]|nr:six-cysteine ranthipeptide SCIFF [Clostridiales bacterium]